MSENTEPQASLNVTEHTRTSGQLETTQYQLRSWAPH